MDEVEAVECAAPPVTFALPGGVFGVITEAAIDGYAGMALQAAGDGGVAARPGHLSPADHTEAVNDTGFQTDAGRDAKPRPIGPRRINDNKYLYFTYTLADVPRDLARILE